jgi:hypothetical protein
MLIDEFMPRWEAREAHSVRVRASPEATYEALRTADLGGHPVVRALLILRALPAAVIARLRGLESGQPPNRALTLRDFEEHGFRVLAEDPPRELVLGLEGAFWKPSGELREIDPTSFRDAVPVGIARAAWNFSIVPAGAGHYVLRTETRILTGDGAARRRFRIYWMLIRPWSGLIRRLMLRGIRRQAESSGS